MKIPSEYPCFKDVEFGAYFTGLGYIMQGKGFISYCKIEWYKLFYSKIRLQISLPDSLKLMYLLLILPFDERILYYKYDY